LLFWQCRYSARLKATTLFQYETEAMLENCRALIKQIIADLSAEKPFVNASSAVELLSHLEAAAAALKKSFGPRPPEH
jgi:hypothetical protein